MGFSTDDQREALREIWPQAGDRLVQLGLSRQLLLGGKNGIPVDGGRLQDLMDGKMMTPAELAAAAGVSRDMIYKAISGARGPSPALLVRIARQLGVPAGDLLP
jgi:transcriptional regulator with XRE-family HTH domain